MKMILNVWLYQLILECTRLLELHSSVRDASRISHGNKDSNNGYF